MHLNCCFPICWKQWNTSEGLKQRNDNEIKIQETDQKMKQEIRKIVTWMGLFSDGGSMVRVLEKRVSTLGVMAMHKTTPKYFKKRVKFWGSRIALGVRGTGIRGEEEKKRKPAV